MQGIIRLQDTDRWPRPDGRRRHPEWSPAAGRRRRRRFLRRAGADTGEVKKYFQNDLDGVIARYDIIQNARIYRDGLAIAAVERNVGRVTAAQAADELLNIAGIDASIVLFTDESTVYMSGRSAGETNVQVILEELGGGGNAATAGAQIPDKSVRQVLTELVASIDKFYEG